MQIEEWSDERVRFRTTSPGTPHVVRMSYFPNWKATGGSMERGENSMMLVTPAQNRVELVFARTPVETAGTVISVAAALALLVASLFMRRFRRDVS